MKIALNIGSLIVVTFASMGGAVAALPSFKVAQSQGKVSFLATGKPAFLKIKGEAKGPTGEIQRKDGLWTARFEFDLANLDTGIELRNSHMKDNYLEVAQHPRAILTIADLALPQDWLPTQAYKGELPFTGEMELHGEKKKIQGTASVESDQRGARVTAKTNLKISDYKIAVPKYAGVTVADTVDIEVVLDQVK